MDVNPKSGQVNPALIQQDISYLHTQCDPSRGQMRGYVGAWVHGYLSARKPFLYGVSTAN